MESVTEYQLDFYEGFPSGLDQIQPTGIRKVFPNPSIIEIKGESKETLFLSVLLHGNETTSFYVIQELEKLLRDQKPNRSLAIFIGNVWAAEKGLRFLPDGPDFNRIWNEGESAAHRLAQRVIAWAATKTLFANIDIHNNTGKNPLYGCISRNENQYIGLARHFSDTMVYFTNPPSVQSIAFSKLCPSVTIECGQVGNEKGILSAQQYVWDVLNCKSIADQSASINHTTEKPRIFHTIGRVMVKPDVQFEFLPNQGDVTFVQNVENFNFLTLEKGTPLAEINNPSESLLAESPLYVVDEYKNDVTKEFLRIENRKIVLTRPIVPAMFTKDLTIIKGDCFGYFMEPFHFPTEK